MWVSFSSALLRVKRGLGWSSIMMRYEVVDRFRFYLCVGKSYT